MITAIDGQSGAGMVYGFGVPASRKHNDATGTPVVKGCRVTVLGSPAVKVKRLHGEGQFVFERKGIEVTQFCCAARVLPKA